MKTEARLSLAYFIFGFAWILVTDLLVVPAMNLPANLGALFDSYKGWLYVAVTAAALYLTLHREFNRRRLVEAEMLESKRLTERIISTVPDAIQIIDLNTQKTSLVNETARLLFGDDAHRTGGDLHRLDARIHPDDLAEMDALIERTRRAADGEIVEIEYRLHDRSGNWRVMNDRSAVFARNPDGSVAQMLSIAHDVTERKLDEEQLMFQVNVLRNVSDAIISVDADYRVTSWNHAAEAIYGYTAEEAQGKPLRDLIHTDFGSISRDEFLKEVRKSGYWRGEVVQQRKDGARVDAYNASTLLKDRHGNVVGLVAVLRDMTEQKRLQDEARKNELLRVDLEREMEARTLRSRFMSTVSHEFRTPLTTIQLAAELLEHYFDRLTVAGRQERLVQIEVEVKRLLSMLDDILLVLKTEGTGQYFSPTATEIGGLVREVVAEFQLVLPDPARLTLTLNGAEARVVADCKILRQAIVNLVSNAIKYSPPDAPVAVRLVQNGMRVSVSVEDRGIGILPDDLKHLGEAFYRGTNVTNVPGTGLGLLITKQAVELHGGSLEVESQVGRGTTATIHLPTVAHPPASVPSP